MKTKVSISENVFPWTRQTKYTAHIHLWNNLATLFISFTLLYCDLWNDSSTHVHIIQLFPKAKKYQLICSRTDKSCWFYLLYTKKKINKKKAEKYKQKKRGEKTGDFSRFSPMTHTWFIHELNDIGDKNSMCYFVKINDLSKS